MPKLIKVLLQIEEVALGHVINTLDRTPGVAKFDLLFDQKPVTNGHDKFANAPNGGEKKPRKLPVRKEITGEKFIIKSLAKQKGPVKTSFVRDAFQKDGRQPDSSASALHLCKKAGFVQHNENGYVLTKKGRDRARYI